jgi:hypothetical protein
MPPPIDFGIFSASANQLDAVEATQSRPKEPE